MLHRNMYLCYPFKRIAQTDQSSHTQYNLSPKNTIHARLRPYKTVQLTLHTPCITEHTLDGVLFKMCLTTNRTVDYMCLCVRHFFWFVTVQKIFNVAPIAPAENQESVWNFLSSVG